MGTTSEKLTYLNTTKTLIKDNLNLGGANISTEPFRAYSSKLKGIYKDFLANGTDTLWNNWEKVSGSGETLSLSPTIKGKMKVDLKGNTQQGLPSGYQAVEYIQSSGNQYIDTGVKVSTNHKTTGELEFMELGNVAVYGNYDSTSLQYTFGLSSANKWEYKDQSAWASSNVSASLNTKYNVEFSVKSGEQYLKVNGENVASSTHTLTSATGVYNSYLFARNDNNTGGKKSKIKLYYFKIYDNDTLVRYFIPCYRTSDSVIGLYDLVEGKFYTNAGTGTFAKGNDITLPTPDTPIDIQVVSGDNTIKVEGKNLFDIGTSNNDYLTQANNIPSSNDMSINNNILSLKVKDGGTTIVYRNMNFVPNKTYTLSANASMVDGRFFIRLRNLTDTDYLTSSDVSISGYEYIAYYKGWVRSFTSTTMTSTITIPNCLYCQFGFGFKSTNVGTTQTISNVQLEIGSTATPYQPYQSQTYPISLGNIELCKRGDYQDRIYKDNGKWYLRKAVEKVDLGDLTWTSQTWGYQASADLTNIVKPATTNTIANILCNVYIACTPNNAYGLSGNIEHGISLYGSSIMVRETTITSLNDFNDMISSAYAYLVLATPTYEEITDTTLLSQLEALAYSYDGTTNISQVNDDMPFILDVTALKEMS